MKTRHSLKTLRTLSLSFSLVSLPLPPGDAAALPASTPQLYGAALALSSGYAAAAAELAGARAALARLQKDPLALRADSLSAASRVQVAEARLRAAALDTRAQLSTDLLAYQSAQDAREVARSQVEAAQLALKGVQYRAQNGAATPLELNQAQADLRNAQSALSAAQANVGAAQSALLKRAGALPAPPKSWALPNVNLAVLEAALDDYPTIISARNDLALAQYKLRILTGDASSAQDVQSARETALSAQSQLDDLSRQQRAALLRAWSSYQNALAGLPSKERSLGVAQNAYKVQQGRYASGAAALLTVKKAAVDLAQAQASLSEAQINTEAALVAVAQAASYDPWKAGSK
ncbi:TolC family protein [Deinococcus sp.]|uniref:TolC family protein n=1 Tax=Deinococcus sp. TaxID=47478 RepID=UPI003CC55EBC